MLHGGYNLAGGKSVEIGALNTSTSFAGTIKNFDSNNGGSTIALVKRGNGTLTLSGNNSYTLGSRLEAGTLQVNHNGALGTGTITLAGGKLQAGNGARTLVNAFVAATGTTSEFISPTNSNLTLNGNLSGDGTIWKSGAYSVFLGGDNSAFAGTFSNRQSNLYFTTSIAGSALAAWDITGGGQLGMDFDGAATVRFGSLTGTTGTVHGGSNRNGKKTIEIGELNATSTYSGVFSDYVGTNGGSQLALLKTGEGIQTLGGGSGFSGGTTIESGTVVINQNSALGGGAIMLSGGKLQAGNGARTLGNALVAASGTTSEVVTPWGNNLTLNGNLSGTGIIHKGVRIRCFSAATIAPSPGRSRYVKVICSSMPRAPGRPGRMGHHRRKSPKREFRGRCRDAIRLPGRRRHRHRAGRIAIRH
ncbi:MAG: autotransporter-associated beta strand repeat-containing protein [Pirellulales bacterium]